MSAWATGNARLAGARVGQAPDPGLFPRPAETQARTWLGNNLSDAKLAALYPRQVALWKKYGNSMPPWEVCSALAAVLSREELERLFVAVPEYALLWDQYCDNVQKPARPLSAIPPDDAGEYPRAAEWNAGDWTITNLSPTKRAAIKARVDVLLEKYGTALPPWELCAVFAATLSPAELKSMLAAVPEYREMWEQYCANVAMPGRLPPPPLRIRGAPTGASLVAVVLAIVFGFARAAQRRRG